MKSTQYSEKVLDHFRNPRNVGVLEGDDVAVGRVGNPVCGDLMEVFIRVKDGRIVDAKFRTFGCGSAIATSSMTTELVKGMTLDEAMKITREDVADELEGLPPIKMHCSNLAADALHEAIKNYRARFATAGTTTEVQTEEQRPSQSGPVCVTGADAFLGKGLYKTVSEPQMFSDKRVLVVHTGDESVRAAIRISQHSPRVILLTPESQIATTAELAKELENSSVKVLYEQRLLEVTGHDELEKAHVLNMAEEEEYDLFVDAVVLID